MTSGLALASDAVDALQAGDHERAAALAGAAAEAVLAEQGEPGFEVPNLLRLRAEALAAELEATLTRARAFAADLPSTIACDRLRAQLASYPAAPWPSNRP